MDVRIIKLRFSSLVNPDRNTREVVNYPAIWAHHGMFVSDEDFELAFGLMHTVEKSAEILVKVLAMRPDKLQTILPQNFRDLAADFKVTLPKKLYMRNKE